MDSVSIGDAILVVERSAFFVIQNAPHGGVASGMIGGAATDAVRAKTRTLNLDVDLDPTRSQSLSQCRAGDPPPRVTSSPGWPSISDDAEVTVYPRQVVRRVRVSRWGAGRITLRWRGARTHFCILVCRKGATSLVRGRVCA
jgi:hypothetical protein